MYPGHPLPVFQRGTNGHPGLLSVIENTFALLEKVQKAANVVLPL